MALITQSEWARRQGFSKPYVSKLVRTGKIRLVDGKIDEYSANMALENQREPDAPLKRKGESTYHAQDEVHKLYIKTKLKNEIEKGKLLEARVKVETGELISVNEVKDTFYAKARVVRDSIMNIPDRVAALLATVDDAAKVHDILTQELRTALEELSRDV